MPALPLLPLLPALPLLLDHSPSTSRMSRAAAEVRVGLMPLRMEEAPLSRLAGATATGMAAAGAGVPYAT